MEERLVSEINEKLNKIIDGLYGTFDEPGSGFITKTNTSLRDLDSKVLHIIEEKEKKCDNSKWTFRMVLTALFAAVIAVIKSFFYNGTD